MRIKKCLALFFSVLAVLFLTACDTSAIVSVNYTLFGKGTATFFIGSPDENDAPFDAEADGIVYQGHSVVKSFSSYRELNRMMCSPIPEVADVPLFTSFHAGVGGVTATVNTEGLSSLLVQPENPGSPMAIELTEEQLTSPSFSVAFTITPGTEIKETNGFTDDTGTSVTWLLTDYYFSGPDLTMKTKYDGLPFYCVLGGLGLVLCAVLLATAFSGKKRGALSPQPEDGFPLSEESSFPPKENQ